MWYRIRVETVNGEDTFIPQVKMGLFKKWLGIVPTYYTEDMAVTEIASFKALPYMVYYIKNENDALYFINRYKNQENKPKMKVRYIWV